MRNLARRSLKERLEGNLRDEPLMSSLLISPLKCAQPIVLSDSLRVFAESQKQIKCAKLSSEKMGLKGRLRGEFEGGKEGIRA